MDSKPDSQFTPPCPSCSRPGVPHAVTIENWESTLTYVCRACNSTWTDLDPVLQPLVLEDQPSN
jgi:hypothetical protein